MLIGSYLKIAFRSLLVSKLTSLINILGLSIGLLVCLVVYLFIDYESSFDKQYRDYDRVYRVQTTYTVVGQNTTGHSAKLAPAASEAVKDGVSGLEAVARIYSTGEKEINISKDDLVYAERHVYFADKEIFDIFDFDVVEGDLSNALNTPFSVVLTESLANKYFSNQSAIGKLITYKNQHDFQVGAVIKDLDPNTHLEASMLLSIGAIPTVVGQNELESWYGARAYTYLKTEKGVLKEDIESVVDPAINGPGAVNTAYDNSYYLMPLQDIHLKSHTYNEIGRNGDIKNIYVFISLSLIILLVISINFINLSTVRAMKRAKEIGVRKSLGAVKRQIQFQFLVESVLTANLSAFVGLVGTIIILPLISNLFGREIEYIQLLNWKPLLFLIVVASLVGAIAGSYPAIFLSAFEASRVLKGDVSRGKFGEGFKRVLIGFQFSITVFLIICTAFMYFQMKYVTEEKVGYNPYHKLMVRLDYDEFQSYKPIKDYLLKHPEIKRVIGSSSIPTAPIGDTQIVYRPEDKDNSVVVRFVGMEHGFMDFYGMKMLLGRTFDKNLSTDLFVRPQTQSDSPVPIAFILNELAVAELGYSSENALGVELEMGVGNGNVARGKIVGIMEETNFGSFKNSQGPVIFYMDDTENSRVSIEITGRDIPSVIEHIEEAWRKVLPGKAVRLRFVDEMFYHAYKNEQQQLVFFSVLSGLSIFLSLLGLYGLTTYNAERRAKEIAIRKVLGASVSRIMILLSKETSVLMLLSNFLAWPCAYLLLTSWLSEFVHRIDLNIYIFILSSLAGFALAWGTLAVQAMAVVRKPVVEALKYE